MYVNICEPVRRFEEKYQGLVLFQSDVNGRFRLRNNFRHIYLARKMIYTKQVKNYYTVEFKKSIKKSFFTTGKIYS